MAAREKLDDQRADPLATGLGSDFEELDLQAARTHLGHPGVVINLDAVAELHPGQVHIWLAIGWCEKRLDRIERAISALEEAALIDPENALVHYNLACYFSLAGDADMALDELDKASRVDVHYLNLVKDELDFDPIRDDPRLALMLSELLAP